MNCQCRFCEALYPVEDQSCPVCKEPNPLWEAKERAQLLQDIGYEAAWPVDSRSRLRRIAAQKGEPGPEFE